MFWVVPSTHSIDKFIAECPATYASETVIVLDDLQMISNPADLTIARLQALCARGKLIITIHESALSKWAGNLIDHSTSENWRPSGDVLSMILSEAIELKPTFSENEIVIAKTLLNDVLETQTDFKHLPAWAASIEALTAKAHALVVNGSPTERALISAAIDAKILFPEGVLLSRLEALARRRFHEDNPNGLWSTELWFLSIEKATAGVVPGSPHSILMKQSNGALFTLLDGVWNNIRPPEWQPIPELFPEFDEPYIARLADMAGFRVTAISLLNNVIQALDGADLMFLGYLYNESGEKERALETYEKALQNGEIFASTCVGNIYADLGRFDESIAAHTYAINHLSPSGDDFVDSGPMNNLGLCYMSMYFKFDDSNYLSQASDWFSRAIEIGNPWAMNNLGFIGEITKNFKLADECYLKSAEDGYWRAMMHTGRRNAARRNYETALDWLKKAYETNSHEISNNLYFNLALLLDLKGELINALDQMSWIIEVEQDGVYFFEYASLLRRSGSKPEMYEDFYREAITRGLESSDMFYWLTDLDSCGHWDEYDLAILFPKSLNSDKKTRL
jgi:tetratricopeptide (TPR) repeat protein